MENDYGSNVHAGLEKSVRFLERFCYKRFLRNSSGTKFFVRLREVSALEDVRFREVPLYINRLFYGLTTNVKFFADDTSLFSIVHSKNMSTFNLNNDLDKIKSWAIRWKMNFNPNPSEQAQEVIFSRKLQNANHNQFYFNYISVE